MKLIGLDYVAERLSYLVCELQGIISQIIGRCSELFGVQVQHWIQAPTKLQVGFTRRVQALKILWPTVVFEDWITRQ